MWLTLLVMAAAISLEPFRIGMALLMLNRPRPLLQLLAFLIGGFAMGMTVGLVVIFALRSTLLGSPHFTLPKVQIVSGALILVLAAVLASGLRLPGSGEPGTLSARARRLRTGTSLWVATAAGLGIALPSVDYLAALAVIVASGSTAATQVGALVMFNVVAFALVEVPLVAYVVAPNRTRTSMAALDGWMRSRRRRDVAVLVGVIGCVLLTVGILGL